MDNFWKRVELHWNRNKFVSWGLPVSGFLLVLWTTVHAQSPGISVGLLALAAGIMSIRPKMHSAEKIAWLIILIAFAVLEIHAIRVSDKSNLDARNTQNAAFQAIVDKLVTSTKESKTQYESTLRHLNGVLTTTQRVSTLARENLENITGGDSFATIFPSPMHDSNDVATLNVHNYGKQVLLGVVVTVYRLPNGPMPTGHIPRLQITQIPATDIGSLARDEGRTVPNGRFIPQVGADGIAHYLAYINSQTQGVAETLDFKPSANGLSWDWRMTAWRSIKGKHHKGDVYVQEEKFWKRTLKSVEWTKPLPTK